MRIDRIPRCFVTAALMCALGAAAPSPASASEPLTTGPGARILCRVPIPSARRRHGEVRLVRAQDGVASVQTLLYSASLRRGVHEITLKERRLRPADDPMFTDSQRYLQVLERAMDTVQAAFEGREDRTETRQKLLIEVVLGQGVGRVAAYGVNVDEVEDSLRIVEVWPLGAADVSAAYARESMETILRNALNDPAFSLDEALRAPDPAGIPDGGADGRL